MVQHISAYLLITNVAPSEWHAPVKNHRQVIGRHPDCDICVPSVYMNVSRRHLLIGSTAEGIWLQDLGSSGGTALNGVPLIADCQTLAIIGDRLSLGGLELYLVSPEASVIQKEFESQFNNSQSTATGLRLDVHRSIDLLNNARLQSLTPAELDIVRWICRGLTAVEEMAKCLYRSPHTVRTQLNSIYKKLDVHSREELLAWVRKAEIAWTLPDNENKGLSEDKNNRLKRTDH